MSILTGYTGPWGRKKPVTVWYSRSMSQKGIREGAKTVARESPSDCEVSVVIATRNRYELVEFTLFSLYEQSVPAESFEVIVVDDASTDGTARILSGLRPPFPLKVLRNETNMGAAFSRNRGIRESKGRIIIILDEMLVGEDYIQGQLDYHLAYPRSAVTTSFNGRHIYTHYYSDFSSGQKQECRGIYAHMDTWYREVKRDAGRQVLRLVSPLRVIDHSVLKFGLVHEPSKRCFNQLQNAYGASLERSLVPWVMLITNSVSITREMLDEVGLFDEGFKGAWLEDWELGYRLHKAGASFINAPDLACYHQAHPISTNSRLENYLYFARKHPVTEVLLVGAMGPPFNWSLALWATVVTQYRQLKENRVRIQEWIKAFHDLALTAYRVASEACAGRCPPLLTSAEIGYTRWSPLFSSLVNYQFAQLQESGKFPELLGAFRDLLRLPIINR